MRDWWDAVPGRVPRRAQPARRGRRLHDPVRARRRAAAAARARPALRAVAPRTCARTRSRAASASSLARLALAHGTGAAPSPCFAALLRDIERASLEAGPALRRIYSHARGDELLAQLAPLGFAPLAGRRRRRARRRGVPPIVCDLGPESVAGWLSGARRARPARRRRPRSTRTRASSSLDGRRDRAHASSSATCCATCATARARPVARDDAAARRVGLRVDRRLQRRRRRGLRACAASSATARAALETVRGVGYRLRPL